MSADLRLGRWQSVLADVECDALITDPPYSPRVHDGQRTGSQTRKSTLEYDSISQDYCHEFARHWAMCTRHWAIVFSDHTGSAWWESAWTDAGWYVFAPVIWHRTNPTPRIAGDGPTSAVDYITVARPRRRMDRARIGSRTGYYPTQNLPGSCLVPGGKQLDGMRSVVVDYTLPNDLVADPHAGGGTTLLAALIEGRRAVGAECLPEHYEIARKRLAKGYTPATLFSSADKPEPEQLKLGEP